jgi:phosphoribosylformimino-5-aminoimidazole carboxamide ribotide isomerase
VLKTVSFRVIPVIDLKEGMAVHAVGGHRDQYRPLRSIWQASGSPTALAAAIREGLDIATLYLADLDAIEGRSANLELYGRLAAERLELWLDAGVRDVRTLEPLIGLVAHGARIVVGLESVNGPRALGEIIEAIGPDRAILSLDMDDGTPRIARGAAWSSVDPREIAAEAIERGVRHLILLDLARVGTGRGAGTEDLVMRIQVRHPAVNIAVGGGMGGVEDVLGMRRFGASAALVGSAIHDGRIGRSELERIAAGP